MKKDKFKSIQIREMLELAEGLLANISSQNIPFSLLRELNDLKQTYEENSLLLASQPSDLSKQFRKSQILEKTNKQTEQIFHRKLEVEDADKTRILFSLANTVDDQSLKLDKEISRIKKILELSQDDSYFEIKDDPYSTYNGLEDNLLKFKPHIVHFSGHGSKEGIYLKKENDYKELITNDVMCELLNLFIYKVDVVNSYIKLVIFNYCNSTKLAEEVSKISSNCVTIGMTKAIPDNLSIVFSESLYKALGHGRGIDFAFDLAKNKLKLKGDQYENIPILFQ